MINKLFEHLVRLWPKTRKSNPVSKLLRPVFEQRKLLPAVLVAANSTVLMAGVMIPTTHAFSYERVQPQLVVESEGEVVTTATTYEHPVPEAVGVSQGYHPLHRGVDIRAPKGSEVVAISEGVVIAVREQALGYGKHVRIAHAGTVSSLYAHLDSMEVAVGERVQRGEKIGTVGMTGWTTGSHLHFELSEGLGTMNPTKVVSGR